MPDVAHYQFPELRQSLSSPEVIEIVGIRRNTLARVEELTDEALTIPLDFPAVLLAVLPDDRVAIAVDSNVAEVQRVLVQVVEHLSKAQPSGIDVVLSDEASEELLQSMTTALAGKADVHVHRSDARKELRYVGADAGADPVYLNRFLVDADFVLPIVSDRGCSSPDEFEHAGVFPDFADSLSRRRHSAMNESEPTLSASENFAMTLGVQVVLSVIADENGKAAAVNVGTPRSLHERSQREPSITLESLDTSIIVASLDGDEQQQTWINAARAATTASRLLDGGGTIILWTRIKQAPDRWLSRLDRLDDDHDHPRESQSWDDCAMEDDVIQESADASEPGQDGFPLWNGSELAARELGKIAVEYRVLLHSELAADAVESIGLGVVDTLEDLSRLTKSYATCGLLRAASQAWFSLPSMEDPSS